MENVLSDEKIPSIVRYFNWDFQAASCNDIEELTKLEQVRAINAFAFLKTRLGDKFPEKCSHPEHPMSRYFWNMAPWTRAWFTWLAECLRELTPADDFAGVFNKLCSDQVSDVKEAISLLETAWKFHKVGWKIQFSQPVLNSENSRKVPDIMIENPATGEKIVVEVTCLLPEEDMERYNDIAQEIFMRGREYAGRLDRKVSKERWAEFEKEIIAKTDFSVANNCFQSISHPGIFEMAIDQSGSLLLAEWCAEKNVPRCSLVLPAYTPFERIKSKIKKKGKQNSGNHASILMIHNEDFSHLFLSLSQATSELEETISKFEDLMAVVIIGKEFGGREKTIVSDGMDCLIQKTEHHALSSRSLLIFNKLYKKVPITIHSIQKIYDVLYKLEKAY